MILREEGRRFLQDQLALAQAPVLLLQLGHAGCQIRSRRACLLGTGRRHTLVAVLLAPRLHPAPQRALIDPDLVRNLVDPPGRSTTSRTAESLNSCVKCL